MIRVMGDPNPDNKKREIFYHWRRAGRNDRAIEAGLEALAFFPRDARLHSELGAAYMAVGEEAKAREHYKQSLAINPESARTRALLSMAELRRKMPSYARAEKGALDALAVDPDDYDAWKALAWTTQMYDEEFAMQCNDRLLEIAPECEWVHMQRGQFLASFEGEEIAEGTAWVERALALAPDSAGIHLDAAEFFYRWGMDKKRARVHLATALTLDPEDKDARAWDDRMRLDRHWVALLLRFPLKVCSVAFDCVHKWSDMKIWYLTWPIALMICIFILWGLVIWGITLFPVLKLFECLLIRAHELRWKPKLSWLSGLFGASEAVRWLAFLAASAAYLGSIWMLWRGGESSPMMVVLQSVVPVVFFAIIGWASWHTGWEWWRKRSLHKRLGSAP